MASRPDTRMQGYDTIVALTQNNLNAHFAFLCGVPDGISTRLELVFERDDVKLTAEMAPPTVQLVAQDVDNRSAIFLLHLREGMFEYWVGRGANEKKFKMPFKSWQIAFKVGFDSQAATDMALPDDVRKQLNNLGKGMFSIRQLFMDFQNANLAEWYMPATQTPGLEDDPDGDASDQFFLFMKKYLHQVQDAGHHILGYGVTVENPNQVQPESPSFPPTALELVTSAHQPGADKSNGLDTLCFLMMTQNRAWPNQRYPAAQTWVDAPDCFGTMAISKAQLFDQFLVPRLAKSLPLKTTLSTNDKGATLTTTHGGSFSVSGGKTTYSYKDDETHKVKGTFISPGDKYHHWYVGHSCDIELPASGDTIQITGSSYVEYDLQWTALYKSEIWNKSTIGWTATIAFTAGKDGKLKVAASAKVEKAKKTTGGDTGGDIAKFFNKESVDSQSDSVRSALTSILDWAAFATWVKNGLNGQNRFVFPGGQQFFFKNPQFNKEGDLLVELTYKVY